MYDAVQLVAYSQRNLQEMQDVHVRFKQVLHKKDESHAVTRAQLQEAQRQASHYEALFGQQRTQLLNLTSSD